MQYRIMKIGRKYAVQIVESGEYLDKNRVWTWREPHQVYRWCRCWTKWGANRLAKSHLDTCEHNPDYKKAVKNAVEVKV